MDPLKKYLSQFAGVYRRSYTEGRLINFSETPRYVSLEEFVLHEGRPMLSPEEKPSYRKDTPKACFENAARCANRLDGDLEDVAYAEGFVLRPNLPVAIHHAWVLVNGQVLDSTLGWDPMADYYGVRFEVADLNKRLLKQQFYGLFSNGLTYTDIVFGYDKTFRYRGGQS